MKTFLLLSFNAFWIAAPSVACAAASAWQKNPHGQVRLIAPYRVAPQKGPIYFGIHFKTIPGWRVYWKKSGDAGYPPRFKWEGSRGFIHPEVLYPTPKKFIEPGNILAIGYEKEVVYPVRAIAEGSEHQLHIVANIDYLTCDGSCVPYRYTLLLDFPKGTPPQSDPAVEALLQRYLAQVPGVEDIPHPAPSPVQPLRLWRTPANDLVAGAGEEGIFGILLLGFLGGLILNIMPCVLPVLSIKLLGLLQQGGQGRQLIVRNALASAAGILFSFVILAGATILAKRAGLAIGWGTQFQESLFVACLAIVVMLFTLNLWGLFEIHLLPILPRFGSLGQGEGILSYFASGVFATVLATPCSAPFLGTAVGFALAQPARIILLVFLAIGCGMALPYMSLVVFPGTLRWLPRPGPWMAHLRVVLGFFLAATLVWLLFVLSSQVNSVGVAYFQLCLLGVAFLVWMKQVLMTSRFRDSRGLMAVLWLMILGLVGTSLKVVVDPRSKNVTASATAERLAAQEWIPFNEGQIPFLLKEGRSVFVDVTADWCFTCRVNEKTVLESNEVRQAFQSKGIIFMKADWTNHNQSIATYLATFGRYGIPFYVLYRPGQVPLLFSEFLTKKPLLDALK